MISWDGDPSPEPGWHRAQLRRRVAPATLFWAGWVFIAAAWAADAAAWITRDLAVFIVLVGLLAAASLCELGAAALVARRWWRRRAVRRRYERSRVAAADNRHASALQSMGRREEERG